MVPVEQFVVVIDPELAQLTCVAVTWVASAVALDYIKAFADRTKRQYIGVDTVLDCTGCITSQLIDAVNCLRLLVGRVLIAVVMPRQAVPQAE